MKKVAFITALTAIFAFSAVMPVSAAVIDAYNAPGNVVARNITQNPSGNWSTSVSANAGDTIAVGVYYSNAGPDTARNVVARLTPAQSGSNSTYTFTGTITSDNAPTVSGTVTINVSSAQTLTWQNQVYWVQNSQGTGSLVATPNNLFGAGLSLGNILVNNGPTQGYGTVVANFTVGTSSNPPAAQDPSVTTGGAQNVQYTTATLAGQIDTRGASNVTYWFEWGNSPTFGNTVGNATTPANGVYNPTFTLGGLTTSTQYWYRLAGQRPGGPVIYGSPVSFTTLYQNNGCTNCFQTDPSVTTNSASGVSTNSAQLNGFVDPHGVSNVNYWFEYGMNNSFGYSTGSQTLGSSGSQTVGSYVSNLSTNTSYTYRIVAQRPGGPVIYGSPMSFVTSYNNNNYYGNSAPSVTTNAATNVNGSNSMTLNGYLSSVGSNNYGYNNGNANVWFEWGPDTSMYNRTSTQSIGVGSFASTLTNLNNGQTYYFRAAAQNGSGTSYGSMMQFTAGMSGACYGFNCSYSSGTVIARTNLATQIYSRSAVLNGTAQTTNSYAQNLNGWFEWGTTLSLGNQTPSVSLGSVSSTIFAHTLSGLTPSTTYYYRAVVQDQYGNVARGDIYRVTTALPSTTPVVTPTPSTPATPSYTVSPISLSYGTDKLRPLPGDMVTYRIGWRNESGARLNNVLLRIELPNGVSYLDSQSGIVHDRQTLLYPVGTIAVGGNSAISFRAVLDRSVVAGAELPVRITMSFTNGTTGQDGSVTIVGSTSTGQYQNETVTQPIGVVPTGSTGPVTPASNAGANLFAAFSGTFFPQTAVGWLFFILLLVLLVVLIRKYWMRPTVA